jgi:hypothetical protein
VHLFRDGEMLERTLTFAEAPLDTFEATAVEAPGSAELALRRGWLGA